MTVEDCWEDRIERIIQTFPKTYRDDILKLWYSWLDTSPASPLHESWSEFSQQSDDQEALFSEKRVYLKRVRNELREIENPPGNLQKIAKALASVASLILVVFLAFSRVFRVAE
jgi:hypothetical protein